MSGKIALLRPPGAKSGKLDLGPIVAELRHSRDITHNIRLGGKVTEVPSATAIAEILDGIVTSLFPTHLGPHGLAHGSVDLFVTNTLATAFARLSDQIGRGLQFDAKGLASLEVQRRSETIIKGFAAQLPAIRGVLVNDLRAAQRRDASADSLAEVLILSLIHI